MIETYRRQLAPFLFPVEETTVYSDIPGVDEMPVASREHKAITRSDTGALIAIQRNSYKLVSNQSIIEPLLEEIEKLNVAYYIDPSHSFVSDQRMRLQLTFPEYTIHDGRSDIALSLYLHNSYDSSNGVQLLMGAIRGICKNGMVFGTVLSKFYGRHTLNFDLSSVQRMLTNTGEKLPVIKHRIEALQNSKVDKSVRGDVQRILGQKITKYIEQEEEARQRRAENLWALYNLCTWYISHKIQMKMRADYQIRTSKIFGL
ncbi:MAG: DUF932 domain-containing protein [Bacteroidetes bacterium]|nr:DUF932 domain-containing protein [Bacteroidota bacterium]